MLAWPSTIAVACSSSMNAAILLVMASSGCRQPLVTTAKGRVFTCDSEHSRLSVVLMLMLVQVAPCLGKDRFKE